jgi:VIT1/CCC1 family predicted Fe2+/Mn2+ transporter
MVLSFTGSLSAATAGREDVHTMLLGALGCNLAWGIVDAVMYLLNTLIERARSATLWRALHAETEPSKARKILLHQLPEELAARLDESLLDRLCGVVRNQREPVSKLRLSLTDIRGALGVFLLVFLSTFPVALPFLIIHEPYLAMRISNAVAILCLFLTGWVLGRYAGLSSWRMGSWMVLLGVVLVGITLALGG